MQDHKKKKPVFDAGLLDWDIKPGDDFDTFVNGKWKKKNPVPNNESAWGTFNILNKENEEVKIKGLIEELLENGDWEEGSDEQKITDLYRAFMDEVEIERLGLKPIEDLLAEVARLKSLQAWVNLHASWIGEGIDTPLEGCVSMDGKDSSKQIVEWTQGGLSLGERSLYEDGDSKTKKIRKEFVAHVNKMFKLAGLGELDAGEKILEFETKLAKLHKTKVEMRDPVGIYNPTTVAEMQKKITKLKGGDGDEVEIKLSGFVENSGLKSEEIVVHDLDYVPSVMGLLAETDLEVLKLYSKWQVLKKWSSMLPEKLRKEHFRFFMGVMHGIKEERARDVLAIRLVKGLGGSTECNILGRIYVQKFFAEEDKQKVSAMIENVRAVYRERIENLAWMSDETKKSALKKLGKFSYKIGYPDKWGDVSKLKVQKGRLVLSLRAQNRWMWQKQLDRIGKETDKSRWWMAPQSVNAYFMPPNNEIVFPAAILQPPFYNPEADDALNYGGIMAVIGHEFTHGFDDEGSKYDEKGNLRTWWNEEDRKEFDKLGKAYSKYFGGFEALPKIKLSGDLTLGENIADLGGISLAYYALAKSIAENGEPGMIDGLTWRQRFFLGWARVWRGNMTDEALLQRVKTDPHSPARFRINGPLPHFTPFYEAFNISPEDKMYLRPEARIEIW